MGDKKDLWDISNRPSTKTKLEILKKVFDVWLTIWNKQNWVANEWCVVDLFAGRGKYNDGSYGSPLIFLENIALKQNKLKKELKIKLFFVEENNNNFKYLKECTSEFLRNNPGIESKIDIRFFNDDCNQIIDKIITEIHNTNKHPLFILIDPTGLQIKKTTVQKIVSLQNPKDIIFNYILEGVVRTSGVAKKAHRGNKISMKEIKTIKTLKEFIGDDVNILKQSHIEILEDYCHSLFIDKGLKVIAYDIPYPNREDTLYYLLFASRKLTITNIVKDIYAKQKEKTFGRTLFGGKDFYINQILNIEQNVSKIKRKTLLYKTKVEYGNWTINHVVGCKHGCKFPCYAMMMAKKFGWVKDYEDWRRPRIVENSLELLEEELPKYKNEIDFVHLCFMSDPFMYDYENKELIDEIKELTLKIIERLNKEGIKVTTLTKGIYPDEILNKEKFLQTNEYGITLVSLNNEFKNNFEPFSAPYEERIAHLKKLSDNGLNTWVSVEPYPTPDLDNQADKIERLLEKISFVKKLIFGKLNYRRLTEYNNGYSSSWKNNENFYWEMAKRVVNFCRRNNINYHIKFGTPLSQDKTKNLFKG
jgi:three-Cys-motif partner protein